MGDCVLRYQSGSIVAKLPKGERTLVHGVSFSVHAAERLALVGETGSGKTMTALSVMQLLPASVVMRNGSVWFAGEELAAGDMRRFLGKQVVYIPQNGLEFLNPARTVKKQLYDSLKRIGVPRAERRSAASDKLRAGGFDIPEDILEKYPFQLSGGMAQKVTIAVSACSEARLIIADEPTNGLDTAGRENFIHMLDEVFPGAAKLIITHDIGIAALCDRVLVLLGGQPMEYGETAAVLKEPRHPYTKALIGALVENGMKQTRKYREQEGSCPFYARCESAGASCMEAPIHRRGEKAEWWCSRA